MNLIDKLLGPKLIEDLTETSLWTDTVFRELERDLSDEQHTDAEPALVPIHLTTELT